MTSSALPPPPPPPPQPAPARSGSQWKDQHRPPHVPFEPQARWGLGDALISFGIFLITSVALVSFAVLIDADPLVGFWFPLLLAVPQLTQGAFTVGVAREKGTGLDRDFGFRFKGIDVLLGLALLILGFMLAAFTAVAVEQLGLETPNASVAELIDEASEAETTDDETGTDDAGEAGTDTPDDEAGDASGVDDDDDGITVWIVMVAVFAATAVPVIEELIYRGLWWSALLKRGVPETWTLVITSAVFAAAHLEPGRFPVLFVLGLALGMGRLVTGRIGASIVTHAFINGIAMIGLLATL